MNVEEFLQPKETEKPLESNIEAEEEFIEAEAIEEVQKIVVESFATEKVEMGEKISALEEENKKYAEENKSLNEKILELTQEIAKKDALISEMRSDLEKTGDILSVNSETELSNKISLLDRNIDIIDRFIGETRDQVLEAISAARDVAEKEGRIRKAQILESVLVVNEPTGNLKEKRIALEKFFNENQNILSGTVISELERCGISYKHGEEYLLPAEIIKRTY
jgi:hypothetical protein